MSPVFFCSEPQNLWSREGRLTVLSALSYLAWEVGVERSSLKTRNLRFSKGVQDREGEEAEVGKNISQTKVF